jgi:glucose/arabinose dehydrogenase
MLAVVLASVALTGVALVALSFGKQPVASGDSDLIAQGSAGSDEPAARGSGISYDFPAQGSGGSQPDGAALYSRYCATCHGTDLRGGNAQSLLDGVWQFGDGYGYVSRNIEFGIPHLGMPSYRDALSGDEIGALVNYLYAEQEKAGAVKPDPPPTLETMDYVMATDIWVDSLEIPWAIVFLDKDTALVTERPGRLRMVVGGKLLDEPVKGTPEVLHEGQGGLLDVNIDRHYPDNRWVYLSYSHVIGQRPGEERPPAMTRIVRGRIHHMEWVDEQVLFEAAHDTYRTTRYHYGSRIVFDKKGYMYFSIGERGAREQAQDPTRPNGKIHRIYPDGSIPDDNPFVEKGLATLFTLGNRNPQGLSVHPETDQVWEAEHGPLGGDELNLIRKGVNYGWPVISYGRNYDGTTFTEYTEMEGYAQPVKYWKPSTAVCGIEFYRGEAFPAWKNKLLVCALKYEDVRLLDIKDNRVLHEEVILKNYGRVRDAGLDPAGNIYVVVNQPDRVIRLSPVRERSGQ